MTVAINPQPRTFIAWAQASGRAQTLPLSVLKDSTVGIDAEQYLTNTLTLHIKEPLVSALGGFPNSLKDVIKSDVHSLNAAGIKPVFVFPGLHIMPTEKPFSSPDESSKLRTKAWELYDSGNGAEAVEAFSQSGIMPPVELFRFVMFHLKKQGVDFQVAPYAVWPQLAYLQKSGFIDAVYSSPQMFLYEQSPPDAEKVIVNIDFKEGSFNFVEKARIRQDTQLSSDLLVDAILLSGSSFVRTFPPLENLPTQFSDAVAMIKRMRNVANAISTHNDNGVYLDKFRKARAAIKHHVVLTEDGQIVINELAEAPFDLIEFLGHKFPEELYFYLSRGTIGPQVCDMLITGEYCQAAPLDNNEADEYKRFLSHLDTMRTESLSLLAKSLHRWWWTKDVKAYNWYDPSTGKTLSHKDLPEPTPIAQRWNVRQEVFKPVMEAQSQQWGEFAFCITSLEDESFAAKTIAPRDNAKLLETEEEVRCNTLWRVLQMRKFIDAETHKLTIWGRALVAAIKNLETEDESLIIPLYIAFELFRMNALKSNDFTPGFSGAPTNGSDEDKANTILVSRVCGLIGIDHEPKGYTGPLNRSLLAFNGFSRALTRELRNFTEMTLVNMMITGDINRERPKDDWSSLGLSLPFIEEASVCLGIAAKHYLDGLCGEPNPTADDSRSKHMEMLRDIIPGATDVVGDLEIAFRVWDAVIAGIKILENEGVMETETKQFLVADRWLESRR